MTRGWAAMGLIIGLGVATPLRAAEPTNAHLREAMTLFENLDYDGALKLLDDAPTWPGKTFLDDVWVLLLRGVIHGELRHRPQALGAFREALALDPLAVLPVEASPYVQLLFEEAKSPPRRRPTPAAPVLEASPQPPPQADKSPSPPDVQTGRPSPPPLAEPVTPPVSARAADRGPSTSLGVTGNRSGRAESRPDSTELRPAHELRALAATSFFFTDFVRKAIGVTLGAGVSFRDFEARARLSLGKTLTLGVDADYLFGERTVRPLVGLRGMVVPSLRGTGGGPWVGLRARLLRGLDVQLDSGPQFYSVPSPYRTLVWLTSIGFVFSPAAPIYAAR